MKEILSEGEQSVPLSDQDALHRARALYHDPSCPVRVCDNPKCARRYTGPSVYCSLACAIMDA